MKNTDQVDVSSIRMPFFNMVVFMIKWFFASIIALVVICVILALIGMAIGYLTGADLNIEGTINEATAYITTK